MLRPRPSMSPNPITWRPILILGLLLTVALLSGRRPVEGLESDMVIVVDRFDDTNEPEAQVCSDAPNDCSLRGAITKSNEESDPDFVYKIFLPAGSYALATDYMGDMDDSNESGDLDIHKSVIIERHPEANTAPIIEGNIGYDGRIIDIYPMGYEGDDPSHLEVEINGVIIQGGLTNDSGGGIRNHAATLTLRDSVIQNNVAWGWGGGIANIRGVLNVLNSTFADNQSSDGVDSFNSWNECGGAIFGGQGYSSRTSHSIISIDRSVFINNDASWGGGAICVDNDTDGSLNINDSTFTTNTATGWRTEEGAAAAGGAIYTGNEWDPTPGGIVTVGGSTFEGNESGTGEQSPATPHTLASLTARSITTRVRMAEPSPPSRGRWIS